MLVFANVFLLMILIWLSNFMKKQLRVEISFKDINQLKNKIDFLLDKNIHKINIPCKGLIKKDFLLEVI